MTTSLDSAARSNGYRLAFIICSIAILIIMPLLSHSYGQTGDEWLQLIYGDHIWNYFVHGDKQALDYSKMSLQFQKQEFYGGGFDFPMSILHHWFPSVHILTLRHFFNALTGALLMVFTGLLAVRLSKKWSVGLIALLFIIFSPRIFGESMNNPKDIPFAAGFVVGLYFLIAFLQDYPQRKWKHVIGLALGWAFAFSVRAAGGFLLLGYFGIFTFLYIFWHKDVRAQLMANNKKLLKNLLLLLAIGVAAGYVLGLLTWPWGLQSPLSNPLRSISEMTNRETNIRVLFEGRYTWAHDMPWYYEFKWIFMTNPLIVLAGVLLFLVLIAKVKKQYGLFVVTLLLFGAVFPIFYMIYKHSTVYDTWRHVFFVYPFWVIMGAIGIDMIGSFIKTPVRSWVPQAIAIVGLLPAIAWTFYSHPNQYVYFNELAGGVKGAFGNYDIDYYQNGGLQAANWILKNAQPVNGRKIIVKSNLSGIEHYFSADTARFAASYGRYNERSTYDWDYYITYSRYVPAEVLQQDKWPPANAVYKVEVQGVPLMAVLQRKSNESVAGYEALQANNFPLAVEKYGAFLQKDQSDDVAFYMYSMALANTRQIEPAIAAAKKASELDPSNIEYLQLLAKLYQAKGDMQNAQATANRANELIMAQQENNE
jgi:hypothetical protein